MQSRIRDLIKTGVLVKKGGYYHPIDGYKLLINGKEFNTIIGKGSLPITCAYNWAGLGPDDDGEGQLKATFIKDEIVEVIPPEPPKE